MRSLQTGNIKNDPGLALAMIICFGGGVRAAYLHGFIWLPLLVPLLFGTLF